MGDTLVVHFDDVMEDRDAQLRWSCETWKSIKEKKERVFLCRRIIRFLKLVPDERRLECVLHGNFDIYKVFQSFFISLTIIGETGQQDMFSSHRDERRNQWKQAHGRCHCWKRLATIDQTVELLRIAETYGGEAPLQQYAPRGELLLNLHMHFHFFCHMYFYLQLHLQHVPGRGCHPVRGETSQGLRPSTAAQESLFHIFHRTQVLPCPKLVLFGLAWSDAGIFQKKTFGSLCKLEEEADICWWLSKLLTLFDMWKMLIKIKIFIH